MVKEHEVDMSELPASVDILGNVDEGSKEVIDNEQQPAISEREEMPDGRVSMSTQVGVPAISQRVVSDL